jgi:hypothetical protein
MAWKMMLKHALEAACAARELAEKSLEALETRAYLELGALEAQAHMSQVAAGGWKMRADTQRVGKMRT